VTEIDLSKLERLAQHLLPGEDLTLAVLKGHLLIEEMLEKVVAAHCGNPGLLQESQVNFATKLLFARALTGAEELSVVWDGCKRLNSLRNALVHKLEHPDTQKRLVSFLSIFNAPDIEWEQTNNQLLDFRRKVIFLYGAIQGINKPLHRLGIASNNSFQRTR
jgi:hypothetical protein